MEIRNGLVCKRDDAQALEMEALKTCLAAGVGERSGLFFVPPVVSLDLLSTTLITEFVPGLLNLYQLVLEQGAACEEIFRLTGRALATVHRELRLPSDKRIPLPDSLMSRNGDNVALHGDFFYGNVCCLPQEKKIVLLDWSGAPFLGGMCNYGSRYFDLAWFAWPFFLCTPPRQIFRWPAERLMTSLMSGYREVEPSFEWQAYRRYRSALRPVVLRYWKAKRKVVPSSLAATCAEMLGCLRWCRFPRSASARDK